MTYEDETSQNINNDILNRKEFQLFKSDVDAIKFQSQLEENDEKKNIIPRFLLKDILASGDYLELHSYQMFVRNFLNPNTRFSRLLIKWETGLGKCHKIDTPILLHDGSIKKVQDIKIGDLLMGDDSTPRKVLSLARGIDKMYDIIPTKGDKHTVNQEHVLCLKFSDKPNMVNNQYNSVTWFEPQHICKYKKNFKTAEEAKNFYDEKMILYNQHKNIVEISVKDYLDLSKTIKSHLKVYKVAVDFPEKELPFDPYMIGYWLGDRTSRNAFITTQDSTLNFKHIPHIYKCNSRKNRLKLLAGLIDSNGHYRNNCFKFTQKSKKLINDVIYLCQSLGFACHKKTKKTSWSHRGVTHYGEAYRICISGEGIVEIPTLIPRKKATKREPVKDVLVSEFEVKYVNEDNYYGFTLNGNCRFLLGDFTVTHNTVGALSIALKFINFYQKQEEIGSELNFGSVFIIGFTQQIFRDELFKYPEFGFISRSELTRLNKLKKQSYIGSASDLEVLKKYVTMLKKRLYNRKGNGFFKFYGYKELANHLFLHNEDEKINLHSLNDDEIQKLIKDGKIGLNKELLNQFSNSLLICDEIHNVYNSIEKNNWGVALQTVLNYHNSARAIFLSATPLNNSPTEIVDLLNLLLPREHYSFLKKTDFFDKQNNLLPNVEQKLADYLKGKISFIRNRNPKYMAEKKFSGEKINSIDYLRFIRCPMSKFHFNTYSNVLENQSSLGHEGQYLIDFAIPNPDEKSPYNALGIYKPKEIKSSLENASQIFKSKYNISYSVKKDVITGSILKKENLHQISSKYHKMIENIYEKILHKSGKIFIYHNLIHVSGTLFIQEILLQNGIISEFDNSSDNTLCSICGRPRKDHNKTQLVPGYNEKKVDEPLEIQGGSGKLKTACNEENKSYDLFLEQEKLLTYYKVEDKYILFSRDFYFLDAHLDAAALKLSDTNLQKIISYLHNLPIIVEISNEDVDYITIFNSGQNWTCYANEKYSYFYNQKLFPLLTKYSSFGTYISYIYKYFGAKKTGGSKHEHWYYPARYVIVHSNLERKQITRSLEKFNHINNIDGSKFMILIGSKIIKESHSLNSTRNIMITSCPDNISTLIQIFGRVVRLGSHKLLPKLERKVDVQIYTSSIPKKNALSYEESKYKKKIETFKIIQRIEKIMHQNAIDKHFNYDVIWKNSIEDKDFGLGILPYNVKEFKPHELNLSTFNAFYSEFEVNYIIYILKRLFIETSPVWVYNDLLNAVKSPPFHIDINSSIISQDLFNIALNNILFNTSINYIEPEIQNLNDTLTDINIIDKLQNPDDKIIIDNAGYKSYITQIGKYYTLLPMKNDELIIDTEMTNRTMVTKKSKLLNLTEYLKYDINNNYNDKKERFIKKWETVSINHLELALCDFGVKFHQTLMEDIIEYIFEVWTNPDINKSEFHNFYLKMLYYYDLQKLIAWGHTVNKTLAKKYEKYILPITTKLLNNAILDDKKIDPKEESSGFINLLISSLNKTDPNWISTGMIKDYEDKLTITNNLFDGLYKKTKTIQKINADLLPVGHFFTKIPRFYIPELGGWRDDPTFTEINKLFKENSLIVGYDRRSKTGMSVKFKIRNPIQNIKQYKDSRMIERGSVCSTKSKNYLKELCKKLDIDLKNKSINVDDLCSKIRAKLIYYELKERVKKNPVRWFFFSYEYPDL